MKVIILSHTEFNRLMVRNGITPQNVESKTDLMLISICGSDPLDDNVHYFPENKENVLNLNFDDCDKDFTFRDYVTNEEITNKAFTEEQAMEVYNFLNINKDKNRKTCIVHCAAGISRSAGISVIVNEFFGGNYNQLKYDNPQIQPNGHVIRLMHKIMRGTDYEFGF